ncbi:MAG: zf-HC2 domain-containing protein [bacterium]|nr:zf-HC2 domain-containing protein [bacterium]
MRCRKVRSLLSIYCNEELSGRQQLNVREHLAGCAACRREAAAYKSLREASQEMPRMQLSDDFNTRLLNRIGQERFAETRTRAYMPKRAPMFRWSLAVPALATTALILFTVVSLMMPGVDERPLQLAGSPDQSNDLYQTVEPTNNPNMTANLQKNWSLDRQVAQAERINRLSNHLTGNQGFSTNHLAGTSLQVPAGFNRRAPYNVFYYRVRPVIRVYESSGTAGAREGEKVY